jgi:hypothetical protein
MSGEADAPSRRHPFRENGLSLFFLALFLVTLCGHAVAGWRQFNEEQRSHHEHTVSFAHYVSSSDFGVEVAENWQSEFLQFALYVTATIWLVQRGSSESKKLGREGRGSDADELVGAHAKASSPRWAQVGGLRTLLYSNSLLIAFALIFVGSWLTQSVTGWNVYNDQQAEHGSPHVSWLTYLQRPDFWDRTLQNWQSEFLAVGTMAIFAVYLRQRGSPESKPVGSSHAETTSDD